MKKFNQNQNKSRVFCFLVVFFVVFFYFFRFVDFSFGATATDQVNLSVTVAQTISLNCGADVNLGTLTPGTPVTGTTVCTVTTNAEGGYYLKVKRDDSDTTMDHTSDASSNIADKTAWDPTANSGNGNAAVWSGTGLGFTVCSHLVSPANTDDGKNMTWWGGTGVACDSTSKYAGFPYHLTDYYTIVSDSTYTSTSNLTTIQYKLDVPSTQKSGSYTGSVTYQVVTKP